MSIMAPLRKAFVVPETDGVKCFVLACGHERILSTSDARKLKIEGADVECVECERQQFSRFGLEVGES